MISHLFSLEAIKKLLISWIRKWIPLSMLSILVLRITFYRRSNSHVLFYLSQLWCTRMFRMIQDSLLRNAIKIHLSCQINRDTPSWIMIYIQSPSISCPKVVHYLSSSIAVRQVKCVSHLPSLVRIHKQPLCHTSPHTNWFNEYYDFGLWMSWFWSSLAIAKIVCKATRGWNRTRNI